MKRANTRFAPTKRFREEVGVNLVFTRSFETACLCSPGKMAIWGADNLSRTVKIADQQEAHYKRMFYLTRRPLYTLFTQSVRFVCVCVFSSPGKNAAIKR
jgi:hypothetical protein